MGTLSAKEIENLIEHHPFHQEEYEASRYNRATGLYDIKETVPAHDNSIYDGTYSWMEIQEELEYGDKSVVVPGVGLLQLEHSFGGEGQGDQYYIVLSLTMEAGLQDDGFVRYFRKDGWYASHDGAYLDGSFYEVTPQQKTITVWE